MAAFSPEESRPPRLSNTSSTGTASLGVGQHGDPFVNSVEPMARTLSATANSFCPLGLAAESASCSLPQGTSTSDAARFFQDDGSSYLSPVGGISQGVTQFGTFSTDTGARRNLKVSSIYEAEVKPLVNASVEV